MASSGRSRGRSPRPDPGAAMAAARVGEVDPADWGAPADYADGLWPNADFAWVSDPLLRASLDRWQKAVRHLRVQRSDLRLSLRDVARRAKLPHDSLTDLELGRRWPSTSVYMRVTAALAAAAAER